jgi:hypothetical protein
MTKNDRRKPANLQLLETRRQQELPEIVAGLLAEGLRREEVCRELGYGRHTVDRWLSLYDLKVTLTYQLLPIGEGSS